MYSDEKKNEILRELNKDGTKFKFKELNNGTAGVFTDNTFGEFEIQYFPSNCGMCIASHAAAYRPNFDIDKIVEKMDIPLESQCSLAVYSVSETQSKLINALVNNGWISVKDSETHNRNSGNKISILYKKYA